MRKISVHVVLVFAFLTGLSAQQPVTTTVPRLVRVSNTFRPASGLSAAPVAGVTFSIYRDEHDGAPLWQETQSVNLDQEGRYSALMGSTLNDGMPLELFTSGEPRWLGVRFDGPGEVEQPRTLLTSVPYALKAVDADTLGGLPASSYLLAPGASVAASGAAPGAASPAIAAATTPKSLKPRVTAGVANYIGVFTSATDIGTSSLYQNGGRIGLNATVPFDAFHVVLNDNTGVFTGYAVQNLNGAGFSGMQFYDQNGVLGQFQGFGNSTHEYRINNIASGGAINFLIGSSSKFLVANSGNIGIGTPTPGSKLDVAGDINFSGALRFQGSPVLALPSPPGFGNLAVGINALNANTTGINNTASGASALGSNTTGGGNTASGNNALSFNTTGSANTASGNNALLFNTTGNHNIAIGVVAAGNVSGGNSNNIHIGSDGFFGDSGTIRIGDPAAQTTFFVAGVRGTTTGNHDAIPVMIDSAGQLGTVSSSRRFKEDIEDMGESSRGLMRLRPVTFRYRKPFDDGSKPIQYGLIAEEVADVYPDLVAHSADGQIETVKYQVLDSMLLNELQRLRKEVEELRSQVEILRSR
jgi:hypothetical protein